MFNFIASTRLAALLGDAESMAAMLIKSPKVIGAHRAALLLLLAQTSPLGRKALQMCAREAGRHVVIHADGSYSQLDRVFSKASTKRLAMWAQNRNSAV
jgi:hypothetical protein